MDTQAASEEPLAFLNALYKPSPPPQPDPHKTQGGIFKIFLSPKTYIKTPIGSLPLSVSLLVGGVAAIYALLFLFFVGFSAVMGLFLLFILFAVYFLPTIIVSINNHPHAAGVLIVNLFLGWTFLGWVGALAWACSVSSGGNCRQCNERLNGFPKVCPHCHATLEWIGAKSLSPEQAVAERKQLEFVRQQKEEKVIRALEAAKMRRQENRKDFSAIIGFFGALWQSFIRLPGKVDSHLRKFAGEENAILYRFFQAVLYLVFPAILVILVIQGINIQTSVQQQYRQTLLNSRLAETPNPSLKSQNREPNKSSLNQVEPLSNTDITKAAQDYVTGRERTCKITRTYPPESLKDAFYYHHDSQIHLWFLFNSFRAPPDGYEGETKWLDMRESLAWGVRIEYSTDAGFSRIMQQDRVFLISEKGKVYGSIPTDSFQLGRPGEGEQYRKNIVPPDKQLEKWSSSLSKELSKPVSKPDHPPLKLDIQGIQSQQKPSPEKTAIDSPVGTIELGGIPKGTGSISNKPADPKMYYTVKEQGKGNLLVTIHATPLGDVKTTVEVGAPQDFGSTGSVGFRVNEEIKNPYVEIKYVDGKVTSVKWDARTVSAEKNNSH
jgi:hypothetical protein